MIREAASARAPELRRPSQASMWLPAARTPVCSVRTRRPPMSYSERFTRCREDVVKLRRAPALEGLGYAIIARAPSSTWSHGTAAPFGIMTTQPSGSGVAWSAASAFTRPAPWMFAVAPATTVAVCARIVRAFSGVSEGSRWSMSATMPATCGDAWLVPCCC